MKKIDSSKLRCAKKVNINRALCSIGTLDRGNHFIEIDRAENGMLFLIVHSNSRRPGVEVTSYIRIKLMNK
ncbi:MAG: RtcB family protein [Oscillospiraceae bacterium]|nr:RtcB family protein [Oscillospiraceae bacterium]